MNIKKNIVLLLSIFLLNQTPSIYANEKFVDSSATTIITTANPNAKLVVAELNTGKIVSEKDSNQLLPYKKLINKLAVFTLSEQLRDGKVSLEHRIPIKNDEVLQKLQLKETISIKDAIFLLEQEDSSTLAVSVLTSLNIDATKIQGILDKLTLSNTELNKFEVSEENKISTKNLAYLTQETLKNYYPIVQITSSENYILENGQSIANDIKVTTSDDFNLIGLSYDDKNSSILLNNKDTSFIVTILDSNIEKNKFFTDLVNLSSYLFDNYSYTLLLEAGKHNIKGQDIEITSNIYDLFYKNHKKESLNFNLMNDKIVLLQNYNTLSANNASVFSNYKSNTENKKKSVSSTIKDYYKENTRIKGFNNKEKLDSIISNISFVIVLILLGYIILYILSRIFKNLFRRKN